MYLSARGRGQVADRSTISAVVASRAVHGAQVRQLPLALGEDLAARACSPDAVDLDAHASSLRVSSCSRWSAGVSRSSSRASCGAARLAELAVRGPQSLDLVRNPQFDSCWWICFCRCTGVAGRAALAGALRERHGGRSATARPRERRPAPVPFIAAERRSDDGCRRCRHHAQGHDPAISAGRRRRVAHVLAASGAPPTATMAGRSHRALHALSNERHANETVRGSDEAHDFDVRDRA